MFAPNAGAYTTTTLTGMLLARPCHRQARGAQFGRQGRPRGNDLPEGGEVLCAQLCVAGIR